MAAGHNLHLEAVEDTGAVKVICAGDPFLSRAAQRVTSFQSLSNQCQLMIETLWKLKGAGLAANQIGIDLQIMIVEVRKTELFPNRPESPLYLMVNPTIVWHSEETNEDWEACFSIPGYLGTVPRFSSIEVEYNTTDGAAKRERFEGYVARVIQHEIDHLNGMFFVDRMSSMRSFTTKENYLAHIHKQSNE